VSIDISQVKTVGVDSPGLTDANLDAFMDYFIGACGASGTDRAFGQFEKGQVKGWVVNFIQTRSLTPEEVKALNAWVDELLWDDYGFITLEFVW
jgi:hypothetical protein